MKPKQENNEIPTRVHEQEQLRDPGLCKERNELVLLNKGVKTMEE